MEQFYLHERVRVIVDEKGRSATYFGTITDLHVKVPYHGRFHRVQIEGKPCPTNPEGWLIKPEYLRKIPKRKIPQILKLLKRTLAFHFKNL